MGRAVIVVVLYTLSLAPVAGAAPAETISLSGAGGWGGVKCSHAEGSYVAFLVPGRGTVLLATRPFPGAEPVGTAQGDRLRFSLPELGAVELALTSSHPGPVSIWGLLDRSLEIGHRTGCVSFGDREFTWVSDLKTYLHWVLREVVFRLQPPGGGEPLSLRFADRTVALEVSASGHRPAVLRVREGGTVGLRLPHSDVLFFFLPVILDEDGNRLAVKVLEKGGPFFGSGAAREIAFVEVATDSPGVTATDPRFEIRLLGIE